MGPAGFDATYYSQIVARREAREADKAMQDAAAAARRR